MNSEFPNNFVINKIKICCACFINKMLTSSLVAKALDVSMMSSWAQTWANHVYEFDIFGDTYILHAYCKPMDIGNAQVSTYLPFTT
jgi:hypothetical protein